MTVSQPVPDGALVFLYNHDAAHQIAHTAGILRELAQNEPAFPLVCATGTPAIAAAVKAVLGDAAASVSFLDLSLPPRWAGLLRAANRIVPAERLARLRWHAASLRQARMIVSPERTCLYLKRRWRGQGPKFVFVPHGAGDRAVSYHRALAGFDYMLVSGPKVADEMIAHGLASERSVHVIGYPKFDLVDPDNRPDFFGNGRTTFVYNPHFDPHLSSWYDHGPAILDWFASGEGQRFNLIFAPHVMLFRKLWHISPEHRVMRRRPGIDQRWQNAPNIRIDVSTERLFDMSYTLGSDGFIGDVSSQIYEFLLRPRAAWFIDVHARTGRGEYPYAFWKAGEKVGSATELFPLLTDHTANAVRYRKAQQELFDYTFSHFAEPSSQRGADWLRAFMATA